MLNQRGGLGDRARPTARSSSSAARPAWPGTDVGHDRGPHVGEGGRHLERLEVVQQELRRLGSILGPPLAHPGVPILAQEGAQLAIDPLALRAEAPHSPGRSSAGSRRPAGTRGTPRTRAAGRPGRASRRCRRARPAVRGRPASHRSVRGRGRSSPRSAASSAPDARASPGPRCGWPRSRPLRRRPGHEDLGRDAEAVHAAELGRVPGGANRTGRPCRCRSDGEAARPSSAATPGWRRCRARGHGRSGRRTDRIAQLAPGAVQDGGAAGRERILGAAVRMVAQHRLAKGLRAARPRWPKGSAPSTA
jgi:hypothetical protein